MTLRKTAVSALVLAAVVTSSFTALHAQTPAAGTQGTAAVPAKPAKPRFQGSLMINGMFQENPFTKDGKKRENVDGGHLDFRLTITNDKLAIDSFSEGNARPYRHRLVYDRNSKILTTIKKRRSNEEEGTEPAKYTEVADVIDLKQRLSKINAEGEMSEYRKKMLEDSSLTMKYTVSDFQMVINGTHCRRITGENRAVKIDFWVSDKIGLSLTDFADIAQVIPGIEDEFLLITHHAGAIPAELLNSFPVRVVMRPKNERRKESHEKEAVIMLQIKSWNNEVDPRAFSLSNVQVRPRYHYDEMPEAVAEETMVDSAAPVPVPVAEPAPVPKAQKKTVSKAAKKKSPARPAQKASPATRRN